MQTPPPIPPWLASMSVSPFLFSSLCFSFLLRVLGRFLTDRFLSPYLSTSSSFWFLYFYFLFLFLLCYANELSLGEEKEGRPFALSLDSSFFSLFMSTSSVASCSNRIDWFLSRHRSASSFLLLFPHKWAAEPNPTLYLMRATIYLYTATVCSFSSLCRYISVSLHFSFALAFLFCLTP